MFAIFIKTQGGIRCYRRIIDRINVKHHQVGRLINRVGRVAGNAIIVNLELELCVASAMVVGNRTIDQRACGNITDSNEVARIR